MAVAQACSMAYMEDLANGPHLPADDRPSGCGTGTTWKVLDENGAAVAHTPELVTQLFDEELRRISR